MDENEYANILDFIVYHDKINGGFFFPDFLALSKQLRFLKLH